MAIQGLDNWGGEFCCGESKGASQGGGTKGLGKSHIRAMAEHDIGQEAWGMWELCGRGGFLF